MSQGKNELSHNKKILGESAKILKLMALIERVASSKASVLITGESGTGKELVARTLHELSPLAPKPFVAINCGAIPENLIESELFGHKRGSFTGAVSEKTGLFEVASGGSLFLDEIGELPLSMQVKLLRALQERSIRRVGGNEDIKIDVRVIAATNRNLEDQIKKGTFREDLYYRLNVILIDTPPLREREGDIKLLAEFFAHKFCARLNHPFLSFTEEAISAIERYRWPGNVRELENTIERVTTLENTGVISIDHFPEIIRTAVRIEVQSQEKNGAQKKQTINTGTNTNKSIQVPMPDFSNGPIDLENILGNIERVYLTNALEHAQGVKKKAAELLKITFRSFRYRLEKVGLSSTEDQDTDAE